jgi:DNA adenine methylase
MTTITPLRYPGGKTRLTGFLKKVIDLNQLYGCDYAEVYAGGAGVALGLLYSGHADRVHINDLNPAVYSFWKSVFERPDDLCEMIRQTPLTVQEWLHQREVIRNPNKYSQLDLGFAALYMNRTNRSGILRGGLIGGQRQDGEWKMDVRFNRDGLCLKIEQASLYTDRVKIYNLDAEVFLTRVKMRKKSLFYLDPPYFVKSKGLYQDGYKLEDHKRIASRIGSLIKPWVVSYDAVPEVWECYEGYQSISYDLSYTAGSKAIGKEVLFASNNLELPQVQSPLELSRYDG